MATKAKSKTKKSEAHAPVLPLPAPLWEHHRKTLQPLLEQWVEQKKVPPVQLLTGPEGIGKRHVVHRLSQWLLCERQGFARQTGLAEDSSQGGLFGEAPNGAGLLAGDSTPDYETGEPCGECANCTRALRDQWIDFQEILPEESGSIKIDAFRSLKASQGFGAHEGLFRIILINAAEKMTPQAANSLLKLIEEPPRGWLFFLTAPDASLLLPTVVSRCQRLRLKPLSAENIKTLLELAELPPERWEICSQLASGSWRKAISLAQEENWEARVALFRFLLQPQAEISKLVDWASADTKKFSLLLDQMELCLGDLVQWTLQPQGYSWVNQDGRRSLETHTQHVVRKKGTLDQARDFWLNAETQLTQIRSRLGAPLNKKLMVQELLVPWLMMR